MLFNTNLPIEDVVPDIRRALESGGNLVLVAPPGAGKTTIVPLALLNEGWLGGRRMIMLEPRRLAARAAAVRMADLLGETVGGTIGYRTRFDTRVGPSTKIEVVTEGILTRMLQNDPALDGFGCVIFDEFHERSIHADLGLALTLESQSVFRQDLRILVMSATLDGAGIASLLGEAPLIKSTGKMFPVEVRYLPDPAPSNRPEGLTGPAFISRVAKAVFRALKEETGSILVFLPGSGEIRRVEAGLRQGPLPPDADMAPLYGELQKELQDMAIRPSSPGRRKVVLATSIAETSLTIEGVRVVIDSGLKRVPRFSASTGMGRLDTVRVSKDSIEQRRGRAGRLQPGVCIRLWPEGEPLRERSTPEILETDLAPMCLELAIWGIKDPAELKWIDPPPESAMSHARELLVRLGAIDPKGNATPHGRDMARLPLHPRLAHMVLKGMGLGLGELACYLASLLSERDIFKGPGQRDPDIRRRLDLLIGHGWHGPIEPDRALCERIKAAAKQIKKQLDIRTSTHDVQEAGLLLAFAYPDRVGKRRDGGEGRYLLANGRGAYLQGPELSAQEFIVAANLDGKDRESAIFLAAPVKRSEIEEYFAEDIKESELIIWDQAQKGVIARRQKRFGDLVLSDIQVRNPEKEQVLKAFLSGIRQNGLEVLPWDRASEGLRARINFLNGLTGVTGFNFPGMSDDKLLEGLEGWLGPWLDGMTRLEHLKRLDMKAVITAMLSWQEQQALDRLAPTHMTVPSGSRIPVDYTGARAVLAVRLQEMFGLDSTPAIADGKVKLLVHLLSPAGRPMQVTEDLGGFWTSSYPMVKKEMKGRYPKHHWPDDPLNAEPAKGAKKRGA